VGGSSGSYRKRMKLPLVNNVSSSSWCHFLRVLIFRSKLKEPIESTDGHVRDSPNVSSCQSPIPCPLTTMFFDTTAIPPFVHPLHSHAHRFICVVPLLFVNSHPELSVSPSPAPSSFHIYVSRRSLMTPNGFYSAMSQFPRNLQRWPHPVDEVESLSNKLEKLADAVHPTQLSMSPTNDEHRFKLFST
jgi:hypothetical protein